MIKSKQQEIEFLKKRIETAKLCYNFCGTLGMAAIVLIPLSFLFSSKTLGLCAVSWIGGSFFAFVASAAKSDRAELEDKIYFIESLEQVKAISEGVARRSVETGFGPIGMN